MSRKSVRKNHKFSQIWDLAPKIRTEKLLPENLFLERYFWILEQFWPQISRFLVLASQKSS